MIFTSMYGIGETNTKILCTVLVSFEKAIEKLEKMQKRVTKMIQGLEKMPYSERCKELHLFRFSKRRVRGDLITAYTNLYGEQRLGTNYRAL